MHTSHVQVGQLASFGPTYLLGQPNTFLAQAEAGGARPSGESAGGAGEADGRRA